MAWIAAIESYRFANNYGGSRLDAHDATVKSDNIDQAVPSLRLDQAKQGPPAHQSKAETHSDRHAEVGGPIPDKSDAIDPDHDIDLQLKAVGSSTAPQIIATSLTVNAVAKEALVDAIVVSNFPDLGSGAKVDSVDTAGRLANQIAVVQATGTPTPPPDTTPPTVPSVATSGNGIDAGGNGDLNVGHVVTLTVAMSEVVTVAGGVPTLSLNNGGTAKLHQRLQ